MLNSFHRQAPKTPFSFKRHIVPPLAGIAVTLLVMCALNVELVMARVRYQLAAPSHPASSLITEQPAGESAPTPDPSAPSRIVIPAIEVDAPVIFDEPSTVEWKVQLALRRGVVHYGTTGMPGQSGNMVLVGHSSGAPWAPGDYKWVFTLLDKLEKGDEIKVSYQGIDYIYRVTRKQVVKPEDLTVLDQTAQPMLSLITCTPVGTSKNRLVVQAEQISPAPPESKSSPLAKPLDRDSHTQLPGASDDSTSFWQAARDWFRDLF
ncbi:class D sortase [Candidatus Saccharibacteria bacterium]|nr:class D sortase [Candidatus Saccharibacteria bacterium]